VAGIQGFFPPGFVKPSDEIFIRELGSQEQDLIPQVRWIYEQSFIEAERDPFENLLAAIQARERASAEACEYCHLQVVLAGRQVAGMTFFNYYPQTHMGFIPYLAVHPDFRNQGLGARLYQRLVEAVTAEGRVPGRGPAVGVAFEVEVPELGSDPADQALRRRRIGFYQRNGAMVVPHLALIAPPLASGLPEMPYEIMFHPLEAARLPLDRAGIEAIVETVLGFSYGLSPDNSYYLRTLASIDL